MDATAGSFTIALLNQKTSSIAYNASAQDLYNALNPILNPNDTNPALPFTFNFAVTKHGNVFQVLFQGQYPSLSIDPADVDTTNLFGSLAIATRTSGIDYYGVGTLNIGLGSGDNTFNVQGTTSRTYLNANGVNDRIYVSSLAAITPSTTTDFLRGDLDAILGPLNIATGTGHATLMISDESAVVGAPNALITGSATEAQAQNPALPLLTTSAEIYVLGLAPSPISYGAPASGDFSGGISIWSGWGNDTIRVDGSEYRANVRDATSLNTGLGDDHVTVSLQAQKDGFFVLNTQGPYNNQLLLATPLFGGDHRVPPDSVSVLVGGVALTPSQYSVDLANNTVGIIPSFNSAVPVPVEVDIRKTTLERFDLPNSLHALAIKTPIGSTDLVTVIVNGATDVLGTDYTIDPATNSIRFVQGHEPPDNSGVTILIARLTVETFTLPNSTDSDNDVVDASASTLPLLIFGGQGDDSITGGQGGDVIFGDRGSVQYADASTNVVSRFGNGGPGDVFSGQILPPSLIQGVDNTIGGDDVISAGIGNDFVLGGLGDDTISGNDGNDVILGDYGSVTLLGGVPTAIRTASPTIGGDDVISGGAGNDIIFGGFGSDTITGISGNDVILGDNGQVNLSGGKLTTIATTDPSFGGNDTITGGTGNDIILGGAGKDAIIGGSGNDTILGDNGRVTLSGGVQVAITTTDPGLGGDDTITGGKGNDIILGGFGNDTINAGGDGADFLVGDNGKVTLSGGKPTTVVTSDPTFGGNDAITGGDGNTVILGGVGGDTIKAGNGNDTVVGDDGQVTMALGLVATVTTLDPTFGGNDAITGGDGTDVILGGVGNDTIASGDGLAVVVGDDGQVALSAGLPVSVTTADPNYGGRDVITGGEGYDVLIGGVGSDTITGGTGDAVIVGDDGQASLSVGKVVLVATTDPSIGASDLITGGGGNDVILGGSGGDTITGGSGNDAILGDDGRVTLSGGVPAAIASIDTRFGGDDTIVGGSGKDEIVGGFGNDKITGGDLGGAILGDDGSILLSGGLLVSAVSTDTRSGGDDTITGGKGDVAIIGGFGNDRITGGAGNDAIIGDNGKVLYSGLNIASVSTLDPGAGGSDVITGGTGNDIILGGVGSDTITGGNGNDVILGDDGTASLVGGRITGASTSDPGSGSGDVIVGGSGNDLLIGGIGNDRITGGPGNAPRSSATTAARRSPTARSPASPRSTRPSVATTS